MHSGDYGNTAALRILYPHRAYHKRRMDMNYDALSELKSKRFKMFFVGDGKDMPALKKLILRLGLEENVIFLGKVTDREQIKTLRSVQIALCAQSNLIVQFAV